jgi:tagatose-1,6-bisphosphate aldolase
MVASLAICVCVNGSVLVLCGRDMWSRIVDDDDDDDTDDGDDGSINVSI